MTNPTVLPGPALTCGTCSRYDRGTKAGGGRRKKHGTTPQVRVNDARPTMGTMAATPLLLRRCYVCHPALALNGGVRVV